MALKRVRQGPVVFFYNGEQWEILGGTPDGWRIWGLGRIYPPPGTYWVELTENATVEHRPTNTGVAIKNQKVVTFKEGEMLLAMYAKKGDALMLTFLAPPPLGLSSFVAAFVRWWRNGAKADSRGHVPVPLQGRFRYKGRAYGFPALSRNVGTADRTSGGVLAPTRLRISDYRRDDGRRIRRGGQYQGHSRRLQGVAHRELSAVLTPVGVAHA